MPDRDAVMNEVADVESGRLSIYDCLYREEVLDELDYPEFDSEGYIIPHNMNWDGYDYQPQQSDNQDGHEKTCCGVLCILFLLFWLFSLATYNP